MDIQSNSLSTYLQHKIVEDKDIKKAFYLLNSIQGVGDKIASFFLRDLVDVYKITLNGINNRHLLQPVDTWVERTVKILITDQGMNKSQVAKWIVCHSKSPELVNMGIWYFGSQIAISGYRLNRVLEDLKGAKSLAHKHSMWIKNACKNCQDFA